MKAITKRLCKISFKNKKHNHLEQNITEALDFNLNDPEPWKIIENNKANSPFVRRVKCP